MTATEQTLWGQLGRELQTTLRSVRSRRNRRELYRRWLEDALLTQRLFVVEPLDPEALEWDITDALIDFFAAKTVTLPVGIPQLVSVPDPAHGRTLEVIAIDLRGQASPRALVALNRAGEEMASARNSVGLAILHGNVGQTDMLVRTISRWVQDYGRGEILRGIPTEGGMLLALDSRRLQRLLERGGTGLPLAQEIAALTELLRASGDTKPLPSFEAEDEETERRATAPVVPVRRPDPEPEPEPAYRSQGGAEPGNERFPSNRQQQGRPRYDGNNNGNRNGGNGYGNGDRPRQPVGNGGRYYGGNRGGGR